MTYKNYRSLKINQTLLVAPVLKSLCKQKIISLREGNWERRLYKFIFEWLSVSNSVKVMTSGTTGFPKEITIGKDKMLMSAKMTLDFLKIKPGETALHSLSCEHIAGKMMVVRAFAGELNLLPVEPEANPLKSLLPGQKIDFAAFVPMQVGEILNDRKTAKILEGIRNVIIGGSPVSEELRKKLNKFRNNIYETYGMTETVSHIALKRLSGITTKLKRQSEYFTVLDGVAVKTDSRNCLVIKAPHLTALPVVTNDIVELKNEKHFKWISRFDNSVNSGGIKFLPELLEEKIRDLAKGRKFFFAGIADKQLGEKLALVIEGNPFPKSKMAQFKTDIGKRLTKYEIPREIRFISKFKLTTNGKILRQQSLKSGKAK